MCLLEVDCLFKWPICAVGSKDYCLSVVFFNSKIAVMHWLDLKSYNEPFVLNFPGFLVLGSMIQLQELLLKRQVAYNYSPVVASMCRT